MGKNEADGTIVPDVAYTLEQAARHMGITSRTLREKLIATGEVQAVSLGRTSITMGWEIIRWIERELTENPKRL